VAVLADLKLTVAVYVPLPLSLTALTVPNVLATVTLSPPAANRLPLTSSNVTVIVELAVPLAGTEVGLAVIVEVTALAAPAVNTSAFGEPITSAPSAADTVNEPAVSEVNCTLHCPLASVVQLAAGLAVTAAGEVNDTTAPEDKLLLMSLAVTVAVYACTPSAVIGPAGDTDQDELPATAAVELNTAGAGLPANTSAGISLPTHAFTINVSAAVDVTLAVHVPSAPVVQVPADNLAAANLLT
jgi:hypothetical protein